MVVVWRAVYVETTTAPALATDADTVVFAVFDGEPLQADEARAQLEVLLDSGEAGDPPDDLAPEWRAPPIP